MDISNDVHRIEYRCFCGPPGSPSSELLLKLKWYDATIQPTLTNTIAAV